MAEGTARFCTTCGSALPEGGKFCTKCGAPRLGHGVSAPTPQAQPIAAASGQQPARPPITSVAGALSAGQTVASAAGSLSAMPWKTVVRGEAPDLSEWLRGGAPLAQQVIRRSVRKPAVVLGLTTAIDALVAVLSGQPAALTGIGLRLAGGLGTSLLGLLVGKRGGFGRVLVGVGSLTTSAFQLWSVGTMLIAAMGRNAPLLTLVPSFVSAGSVLLVTVKTAFMTFRNIQVPATGPAKPGAPKAGGAK